MSASNLGQEAQIFAQGGFVPRVKGSRRVKDLIPDFLAADGSSPSFAAHPSPENPVVLVTALGQWVPDSGYCKGRVVYCWSVRLQSGLRVPAYSLGHGFNVCQHGGYQPRQGE